MLGFGRKRIEEDDDELEKPKRRRRKAKSEDQEDLKDLNPKNKNRRKEPSKPWGKNERFLVLGVVGVTAVTAGILGLSSRSWKLPGLPRIISPELNLERTYVLEADDAKDSKVTQVKDTFSQMTQNLNGVYGMYVGRLYEDESYSVAADEVFTAGSLIKLPIITAILIAEEESKVPGVDITALVESVSSLEDPLAIKAELSSINENLLQTIIHEIGMSNTSVSDNTTTPADMGKLFKKLWEGRLLTDSNTAKIFSYMNEVANEDVLFSGVPEDIRVAYTFSQTTNVSNSAGLVFAPSQPLVIVLLGKGVIEEEANYAFPEIINTIVSIEEE